MNSKLWLRFSLRGFLAAMVLVSVTVGVLLQRPAYRAAVRQFDGLTVRGMWKHSPGRKEQLLYLVVFPQPTSVSVSTHPRSRYDCDYIVLHPTGLYSLGVKMVSPDDGNVWICNLETNALSQSMNSTGFVASKTPRLRLSMKDFESLENVPSWQAIRKEVDGL